MSYLIYDTEKQEILELYNRYIKVKESVDISQFITDITGINRTHVNSMTAVKIEEALESFANSICTCDIIIAHNLNFDKGMILKEVEREAGMSGGFSKISSSMIKDFFKNQKDRMKCTMHMGKKLCNIQGVNTKNGGRYIKFPKLQELYQHFFHTLPKNLHNSLIDIFVCLKCYLAMRIDLFGTSDTIESIEENIPILTF
jgi:DNA polymerase III epsilon subunit-like protein